MLGSPPRRRGKVVFALADVAIARITPAWAGKSCSDCRCSNRRWDHPRIGGEKTKLDVFYAASKGSPPRGRGKVYPFRVGPVAVRITPAWAGKSLFCFTAAVPIQDHPRTGGERSGMKGMKSWKLGSPPHRRGKGIQADGAGAWAGITPAWAGKRLPHPQRHQAAQDHPRVGGEKELGDRFKTAELGSPPRRRGKGWRVVDHHPLPGITPAQAGKSITFLP